MCQAHGATGSPSLRSGGPCHSLGRQSRKGLDTAERVYAFSPAEPTASNKRVRHGRQSVLDFILQRDDSRGNRDRLFASNTRHSTIALQWLGHRSNLLTDSRCREANDSTERKHLPSRALVGRRHFGVGPCQMTSARTYRVGPAVGRVVDTFQRGAIPGFGASYAFRFFNNPRVFTGPEFSNSPTPSL